MNVRAIPAYMTAPVRMKSTAITVTVHLATQDVCVKLVSDCVLCYIVMVFILMYTLISQCHFAYMLINIPMIHVYIIGALRYS